jgi:predicted nicotinamide N-methyase
MAAARSLTELAALVRERTFLAPVPLAPELRVHQAAEPTSLWHATAAAMPGWQEAPYWAYPWAGGQAVARHLLDAPEVVRGRRVFDLGTGCGLVAIAAARAGAALVVACDVDPCCEAAVALNGAANGVAPAFRHGDPIGDDLPGFEVVLAGDPFYDRRLATVGLAWLRGLAARGVLVLAGDPGRNHSPAHGVVERAAYDVPASPHVERAGRLRTRVLQIEPDATRGVRGGDDAATEGNAVTAGEEDRCESS